MGKNKSLEIKTPRGSVITKVTKNGKVKAVLEWNSGFGPKVTNQFQEAQSYVDGEVLRLSEAYVPFQTGMLQKSGTLGTDIGSGEVNWIAPYSSEQYYCTADSRSYDPQRGGHWFERMKIDHGKQIIQGAKKKGGGD